MIDMFVCDAGEEFTPRRGTVNSCGYDIFATEDIILHAGEWTKLDTRVRLGEGTLKANQYVKVVPRSSMGFKHGLRLRNTEGIIDADFPDTIKAVLGVDEDIIIPKGKAYLQMIVEEYKTVPGEIPPVKIRDGGIGSTDKKTSD